MRYDAIIPTPSVRNKFPSTGSTSSSHSRGRHCGANNSSLSLSLSTRRGTTRNCLNPAIPRKSWMRHDPVPRTLIVGDNICGGRRSLAPAPSVSLSPLSLPPPPPTPSSSSCGMPPHPPPYILPARRRWQRRSQDGLLRAPQTTVVVRGREGGGGEDNLEPPTVVVWATAAAPAIVIHRNHCHTRATFVLLRHCHHNFFVIEVRCNDAQLSGGRRRRPGLGPGESRQVHEPNSAAAVMEEAPIHRPGHGRGAEDPPSSSCRQPKDPTVAAAAAAPA